MDVMNMKGGLKGILFFLLFGMTTICTANAKSFSKPIQTRFESVKIEYSKSQGLVVKKAVEVFKRVLKEKTAYDFFKPSKRQLTISLQIQQNSMHSESYQIKRKNASTITVTAADENGILYGLGKLLHTSHFEGNYFVASSYEGTSTPDKKMRGIYFATHFNNFYHAAPIEKVTKYIEELALWGYNGLYVWFDMHHFTGIGDPEAVVMQKRLAHFLKAGKAVGMKSGITMLANEGYKTSPETLRAIPNTFTDHYKVEICPSLPGGSELIMKQVDELLNTFVNLGVTIDAIGLWPYDQGGCECKSCAPWGGNGYLKITDKLSSVIRKKLPQTKIILSTWLFDYKEQDKGEWRGLASAFKKKKPWADYIMADSHTSYPQYPLNNPSPGNVPLLNFPEISMWGNFPWGAYGANPLPGRFQKLWNSVADKVVGGYPYSEGIYEDANKVLYSQFYWSKNQSAREILKEYVSFEFSAVYADDILRAIDIMEKNYGMSTFKWARVPDSRKAVELSAKDSGAREAYDILKNVDAKLSEAIKNSWRWRLLLLRAFLDCELRLTKGIPNEGINAAFQEISDIQYLNNGHFYVRPPLNFGKSYPVMQIH